MIKQFAAMFVIGKKQLMFDQHLSLKLNVNGKSFSGFCMRISDEFYETYAVILEGYDSFSIWLDKSKSQWKTSKYANVDRDIVNTIIGYLPGSLQVS